MKVLIADDDRNLRRILVAELSEEGFHADAVGNGIEALEWVDKQEYDVLLLDLNMPGTGGMDILRKLRAIEMPTEIVVLTGHATVSTAVEAMKLGAYDYLTKPFKMEELTRVLRKAYEKKALLRENLVLKAQIQRQSGFQRIVTMSPQMMEVLEDVKKLAMSDFPVLVHGETGVGKELVAKAVHEASNRSDGPFIPLNCGAIPENLIESELFGYEKGAFTGAHARKLGLLEIASHGTLFLDEIGELSLPLQGKLLRVIETGSFFRMGGTKEIKVDVKFVSATNRDIKREVEKGNFRQDLYYRITVLGLHVPPLRERKEDIPLLVEHFVRNNPSIKGKRFGKEALEILSDYAWPGNVRELQNVVHRTLLLSKNDTIEPDDLPRDLLASPRAPGSRLDEVEREHILKVLKEAEGHRGKAAEVLGVDPKTLYRKLLSYGVDA